MSEPVAIGPENVRALVGWLATVLGAQRVGSCAVLTPVATALGRETLPDIDIVCSPGAVRALRAQLRRPPESLGRVLREYRYGGAGVRIDLMMDEGAGYSVVGLDLAWGVGTRGARLVRAWRVTRGAARGADGLPVAAPAGRVVYSLAKAVVKRGAGGPSLARAAADLAACDSDDVERLAALLGRRLWSAASVTLSGGDTVGLAAALEQGGPAFVARRVALDPLGTLATLAGSAGTALDRVLRPPGACVAVLGPDGSGKSTALASTASDVRSLFRSVEVFHSVAGVLRRRTTGPESEPGARPPYGGPLSVAKALYVVADAWLGWWLRARPATRANGCVLLDRYVYDMGISPARYRLSLEPKIAMSFARLCPRPDVIVALTGPPAVAVARKGELTEPEVTGQMASMRALSVKLGGAEVGFDGAEREVSAAVTRAVLRAMCDREARRHRRSQ